MNNSLAETDPAVADLLKLHRDFERHSLKLIASENFTSSAVMEAVGSIFTNKYAEGYPGERYYEGNDIVDDLEQLAQDRLNELFGSEHANVQPYSGSPANQSVYRALLTRGDKVMGLSLPDGGHLTHGWPANFSGKDHQQIPFPISPDNHQIDYTRLREDALDQRPKLIWVGGTAYPRFFEYELLAEIAAEVNAYLVADIAHINGLIIAGEHPNPVPHTHVVTSTSHKSLRGPRGGFVLCKREDPYQELYHSNTKRNLATRIDAAVFPTLQGGPHLNQIAGLAVALEEAKTPDFQAYGRQVVKNAKTLANELLEAGFDLVSGGTDNHLMIIDLSAREHSGVEYAKALAKSGIIVNFNTVPNDPRPPRETSGLRIGTPAVTTTGMCEPQMKTIASLIGTVLEDPFNDQVLTSVANQVHELTADFQPPGY